MNLHPELRLMVWTAVYSAALGGALAVIVTSETARMLAGLAALKIIVAVLP